jgi:AcrR family transcriptional regulator
VLEATADLLNEVGYDALTYDEIARRAHVHKTTVYRRWPTKPGLVADAVGLHSEEHVPIPDTGSFASDLEALASAVAANIGSEGGARRSRSIVAAASVSGELADTLHAFMGRRIVLAEPIVTRAIERGELPTTIDPHLLVETLVGPIWFRLLLTGEPIDEEFVDSLCTLLLSAAGPAADS